MGLLQKAMRKMALSQNSTASPRASTPATSQRAMAGATGQSSRGAQQQQQPSLFEVLLPEPSSSSLSLPSVEEEPTSALDSIWDFGSPNKYQMFGDLGPFEAEKPKVQPAKASGLIAAPLAGGCYDLWSYWPTWFSHSLCTRCQELESLRLLALKGDFVFGAVRQRACVTACSSLRQRTGIVPTLPLELVEMIVSELIDEAIPAFAADLDDEVLFEGIPSLSISPTSTQLSQRKETAAPHCSAILALLHTSSYLRARVSKQLSRKLPSARKRDGVEERWILKRTDNSSSRCPQLYNLVTQFTRWYFLSRDPATLAHSIRGSSSLHPLRIASAFVHHIIVLIDWPVAPLDDTTQTGAVVCAERRLDTPLSLSQLREVLLEAFSAAAPVLEQSLYVRVLSYMRGAAPVELRVTVELYALLPVARAGGRLGRLSWTVHHVHVKRGDTVYELCERMSRQQG